MREDTANGGYGGYWSVGRGSRLAMEWKLPILGCVAMYLPVVTMLQRVMKNRAPLQIRLYTTCWNFCLAVLSLLGAAIMVLDDWTILTKAKYEESKFLPRTRMVVALFSLTKVIEFGDTIILALKKRPIVFLHTYHHLTVALYCWHAQYMRVNFAHTFVLMNLLVHGAMYLYYGLITIFPGNKKLAVLRPYITFSQISQMVMGIAIAGLAMYSPDMTPSRSIWWNAQLCLLMYISYCFLFSTFYLENFHKSLRPAMAPFLGMFHIFAVVGFIRMCLHQQAMRLFLEAICLYIIGGFGITCGAHRLWAHRSYKANFPFRFLLFLCNSIANQGTIYRWSRDHRTHHKFSDTSSDPHNATRGFFYSHMGWLFLKKSVEVKEAGKLIDCSDLLEDPLIRFQNAFDPYWNQLMSFGLPAIYGYFVYNDYWLGFFVLGAFRWLICLHATWTVNSVAHLWGTRPYNPHVWPRETWFTVLVANGEGWHNWHHEYPFDYAASEGGVLDQWNPSKAVIDLGALLGMVWDRKRATDLWEQKKLRDARGKCQKNSHVGGKIEEDALSECATTSSSEMKSPIQSGAKDVSLSESGEVYLRTTTLSQAG